MPAPDPAPSSERSRRSGKTPDPAASLPHGLESAADETNVLSDSPADLGASRGATPPPATPAPTGSHEDSRVEPRALPNLGEKIDEFRLVESIGAGGMGAVFRAVDLGLDRQVALKILPPEQAIDPEVVRRYHQEGRAAARLDHENIARVYTIGDDGRYHYIAFEYIEGMTIRQKVAREGPLSVADAIHFTLQIAHALVHAAAREVVHRDIKPSNIILTPGGRAKLVDMGLARQFERRGEADLTQTGMTLGTFDYISPEQARDPRDVDIRGDLYSLGCTLFHMLAGRPPFPEGTVLQKLIQHREDAPPDIRQLNPRVPDALAAILVKLLIKDREHRYQTPEHLAHDLGRVAARRTIVLPSARSTPNWARHLFWGGPGLVFLLVLGGMIWWGDGPPGATATGGGRGGAPADTTGGGPPPFAPGSFAPRPPAPGVVLAGTNPVPPREVAVSPADDLARILAEAPPRSTLLLVERGPYELRADRPIRLDRGDLTIRAETGVRPVIRLGRNFASTAAIDVRGGRLTLDGLDFLVDPASFEAVFGGERVPPAPAVSSQILAVISAEDAEVVVRRCSFRRVSAPGSGPAPGGKATAIRLHGSARVSPARGPLDPMVASLFVDASEFDGHQIALLVSGPVDVSLRDVAFGPTLADGASLWADNLDGAAIPAEFRLDHVSGLLGAGPMFRFNGTAPRVVTRHSVFGPIPRAGTADSVPATTLVAIDLADRLDWRGGDNLYARLALFLRPGEGRSQAAIRTFAAWADDPATFRESGSEVYEGVLWERLPSTSLAPVAPESPRSFRLALPRAVAHHPGARWGPAGMLPAPVWLAAAGAANRVIPLDPPPGRGDRLSTALAPVAAPVSAPAPAATPPAGPTPKRAPVAPEVRDEPTEEGGERLAPMPMPTEAERPATDPAEPVLTTPARAAATPDPTPIRSTVQFLEALKRDEPGSRTLVLGAGASLDLPSGRIIGSAQWTIRAERGPTRPQIRFRADTPDAVETAGWSSWMLLRSGGLRLEGIDLILPAAGANRSRAVFALRAGAVDLTLTDCTVTIEGNEAPSAVVVLLSTDDSPGALNPFDHLFAAPRRREPVVPTARVRFQNCLLRSAGDLVDVAAGRSVELDLTNAVVATAGVLVHGHGREDGRAPGSLRVVLRRIATRLTGGLVHLETERDRPALPLAAIQATDTILALANPQTPLLRVDGQGDLAAQRDRITWQGRSVAYHRINTYRRDQTSRPGVSPTQVDRDSWEAAVGPGADAGAIRGDLGFLDEANPSQPSWSIRAEDLKLRPESPAADAAIGPDWLQIPDPPAAVTRS